MEQFKTTVVIFLIIIFSWISLKLDAQVAVNTNGAAANSNSILDISSNTKGLLIPRMSSAQKSTFASNLGNTEKGMLIFDTDSSKYYFWGGSSFTDMKSGVLDRLVDSNGDSEIKLSLTSGSDIAEIKLQNTTYFRFQPGGIELLNNGKSVFLGEGAGENDDQTDNYNTFVGHHAAQNNTSGDINIAVGPASLFNNTTGTFNIGIGLNSLYSNVTASGNTAIGYNTLSSLTVGVYNVVLGSSAIQSMQNGNKNTVFGYDAGLNISSGNSNTLIGFESGNGTSLHSKSGSVFLGYQSGYYETGSNKLYIENSNSTTPLIGGDFSSDEVYINGSLKITGGNPKQGKFLLSDNSGNTVWDSISLSNITNVISNDTNIFIGYNSGTNNTGNFNIAIGRDAMFTNSTGANNIAFGDNAMYYNSTGVDNIAIGRLSLYYNTSQFNVAIGSGSLRYNSTGASNVAVGYSAASRNNAGNANICIGNSANFYNLDGNNNTIVGYESGLGTGLHSKSGNVFLGYKSGYYETGSNKLYIENSNSSTPLIGGDFAADEVYINGTIKITGGVPGSGKILTSDADGNALWQANAAATQLTELGDADYDGSSLYIGAGAGIVDDGSNNNLGLGKDALTANISGNNNSAIGLSALVSNTGGIGNSAFGLMTLFSNTNGLFNTAVGTKALYTNTGNYNTACGYQTLYANTTGYNNSATGLQALFSNTTGYDQDAHGYQSLYYNTTGNYNVAVGKSALYSNTTGSNNVAFGFEAGNFGNTNSSCTYIGYQSRNTGAGIFTNSTALGNQSVISADNQVRIGNASVTSIGGVVAWTNVSDKRFKTNITENVPGLDFIMQLRPVVYNLDIEKINLFLGVKEADIVTATEVDKIHQSGFIAQEVEHAANNIGYEFSGIDKPNNSNDYYGLRYAEFVVPLVKAVQELNLKNEELQTENDELKLRLAKIEERLNIKN